MYYGILLLNYLMVACASVYIALKFPVLRISILYNGVLKITAICTWWKIVFYIATVVHMSGNEQYLDYNYT